MSRQIERDSAWTAGNRPRPVAFGGVRHQMRDRRLVRQIINPRYDQLFKNAIASAVRLRMSSIWSVDWNPMMKASTVPSPST